MWHDQDSEFGKIIWQQRERETGEVLKKLYGEIPIAIYFFVLVKDEVISRRVGFKSHTEKTKKILGDLSHVHIYTLEMSWGWITVSRMKKKTSSVRT